MHMVDTLPIILVTGVFLIMIGHLMVEYYRARSA
jgi:hypothetical protein